MNLTDELFYSYFSKKIDKDSFYEQLGIQDYSFLREMFFEIDVVTKSKNVERLENLIYALLAWDERINKQSELVKYIDSINNLLLMDWHNQHENLVNLIQKISHESSMLFLEKAIGMNLAYMEWDDNYSFEKKCIRAIYHIGQNESASILIRIMESENVEIRNMAKHELDKIN